MTGLLLGGAATLIDHQGQAIRPSITWMDARSEAQCAAMRDRCGDQILAVNGKQAEPYNFDPRLIWLQQHEPDSLRRARTCLTITGYVNFRLTGKPVLNVSDASVPFAFDREARDWSESQITAFDALKPSFLAAAQV